MSLSVQYRVAGDVAIGGSWPGESRVVSRQRHAQIDGVSVLTVNAGFSSLKPTFPTRRSAKGSAAE